MVKIGAHLRKLSKGYRFWTTLYIEHKYKLGYCCHFSVSTITLSGIVAKI